MNRSELAAAIAATPLGGTLTLPGGVHTIDITTGAIPVNRSIEIVGAPDGSTVLDVVPKQRVNTNSLFKSVAPDRSRIAFRDLTCHGPVFTGDDESLYIQGAFLDWAIYRRDNSVLELENVTVTGHFQAVVYKAGGGRTIVHRCNLNAYEAPIKCFGSHGEAGRFDVSDSTLTGFGSKTTSIGIYHHAQFDFNVTGCHFEGFARFAIYGNGSPQANTVPTQVMADCTVVDADIMQAAQLTSPLILRVKASGISGGPGTFTKGSGTWVDSDLKSSSPFTFGPFTNPRHLRFVGCRFEPIGWGVIIDGSADSLFEFTGCEWDLWPSGEGRPTGGRAITTTGGSRAVVRLNDTIIRDHSGQHSFINVKDPVTWDWGRTKIHTNMAPSDGPANPTDRGVMIWTPSNPTIIGAPTFLPAA
jgi:hypothetical protein